MSNRYIVRCRDGSRWLVREARSLDAAIDEIAHAVCLGSIGGKTTINGKMHADVVRINSDNTEAQPYQKAY